MNKGQIRCEHERRHGPNCQCIEGVGHYHSIAGRSVRNEHVQKWLERDVERLRRIYVDGSPKR